ncbi:LysR family transcriptional regulator [Aestuariibius sp. 2305UL40-4]|uniref:LysR family transcriptional regulator n=1 Tax=Aestuariibius violaceus TaxID=3234132 RepID=UPI00345E9D3B
MLAFLRTFLEVYRTGSVSRAATALGMTQPAASGHIRSLEDQIGRPLFTRHSRGVRPTQAADELAAQIGPNLDALDAAFSMIRNRSSAATGTIRLAGPLEFIGTCLAAPLARLADQGLFAHIVLGGRSTIYEALETRMADLAITASMPRSRELGCKPIGKERLVPVASPAWADKISPSVIDVFAHPPVSYDETLSLFTSVAEALGIGLADLRPAIVAPDLRLVRDIVAEGTGWTILPDYLAEADLAAGRLIRLAAAPDIWNTLYLVWVHAAIRTPRIARAREVLLDALENPSVTRPRV